MVEDKELALRTARCSYCKREIPSDKGAPFFEFRGAGSRHAKLCKCGFAEVAHKETNHHVKCRNYTPRGDQGFDSFYCGILPKLIDFGIL